MLPSEQLELEIICKIRDTFVTETAKKSITYTNIRNSDSQSNYAQKQHQAQILNPTMHRNNKTATEAQAWCSLEILSNSQSCRNKASK